MYLNSNSSGKSLAPSSTRKKPLASQPLARALAVYLTARACASGWDARDLFRVLLGASDFTIRRHDGNDNVKNNNRFSRQNNNFAGAAHFLCTFLCRFCMTTTLNCLILLFREDVNKRRRNFILFLHLDMVLRNSTLGGFAYIWQSKWVGIIAIKTERTQIHIWSDVFAVVELWDR